MAFLRPLQRSIAFLFGPEKKLRRTFFLITGLSPINLALYKRAMVHDSIAQVTYKNFRSSYERLEFLGDAVLDLVVAEHLFNCYPLKEEGFLTEMRARIVNRESLNHVSDKIGLKFLVQHGQNSTPNSILGDALEALIGATYLDHGFLACKRFVIHRLIIPHFDLDMMVNTTSNHKSKLLEWCQKFKKKLSFILINDRRKEFKTQILINEQPYGIGYGNTKKKSEQDAALKTCDMLNI